MRSTELIALEVERVTVAKVKTLVSKTIGRTAIAQIAKVALEPRKWDEASVLEEVDAKDLRQAESARSVLTERERAFHRRVMGGVLDWLVFRGVCEAGGTKRRPFALGTYGVIEIQFQYLQQAPDFC